MGTQRIVGISGSVSRPSRTTVLVGEILAAFGDTASTRLIEIVDEAPHLFASLKRSDLTPRGRSIIDAVESADLLVVGSPVYRASYTGALKHMFDLVDYRALAGVPMLFAATGGTPLHGLMTEHQFRPLAGFFNAPSLPTTIYALESDFQDYRLTNAAIHARIAKAAAEGRNFLAQRRATQNHGASVRLAASA